MKLKEALEFEKEREERGDWNRIYLHQDGKFYHAYEWSAWLIKAFAERDAGEQSGLKVSLFKSANSEYAIGGFPLESLSKFIPVYIDARPLDEKCLAVEVEVPEDCGQERMGEEFGQWRQDLPVKESRNLQSRQQVTSGSAPAVARTGLFASMAKVLSYPVEVSTPAQNIEFISRLKQEISALL